MQETLLIESGNYGCYAEMVLNESSSKNSAVKFRGKFQECDAVNKNKRSYPRTVLERNMQQLKEAMENRGLLGELDHPSDSIIHFEKCSHLITKLWWENNVMMGEGEVLNTPAGEILKNLLAAGVRVGISSRGVGSGSVNEDGILVIGENFKLVTFDAVADPSTFQAYQRAVDKKESYIPQQNATKIESVRINKQSTKEALIACLGGVIGTKTKEITSKIG